MSLMDVTGRFQGCGAGLHLALPTDGQWRLLHTKSRQEKLLADDLRKMGIDHFLPLVKQNRLYGKRKFMVELPLFPGYVFVRGTLERAYETTRTHRVARVIEVADQSRLDWELRNLYMALCSKAPLDPHPFLKKGVKVEVRTGALRGLQGLVENRSSSGQLVLQVEMLGRALTLEIPGELLERV